MTDRMKLYEIPFAYEQALRAVDPETGEYTQEAMDAFDKIEGDLAAKLDSIAKIRQNLKALEAALRAEAARLTERARVVHNNRKRLDAYVARVLERLDTTKVRGPLFTTTVQPGRLSVNVTDVTRLPGGKGFYADETVRTPDKKAIMNYYKQTHEVPTGVEIIKGAPIVQSR